MIEIFDLDENAVVAKADPQQMSIVKTKSTDATERYLSEGNVEMIRGSKPEIESALVDEEYTRPETEDELLDTLRARCAGTPLTVQKG